MTKYEHIIFYKREKFTCLDGARQVKMSKWLKQEKPWRCEAGVAKVDDAVGIHVGGSNLNNKLMIMIAMMMIMDMMIMAN